MEGIHHLPEHYLHDIQQLVWGIGSQINFEGEVEWDREETGFK